MKKAIAALIVSTLFCLTACGGGNLKDSRDGKKYKTVKIGEQVWMAENLNFDDLGVCYNGNQDNCKKYGKLYTWDEAMKACPDGWHLPSVKEWTRLFEFVGGVYDPQDLFIMKLDRYKYAGGKLKAKEGWPEPELYMCPLKDDCDQFGFAALPSFGEGGSWWTATKSNMIEGHARSIEILHKQKNDIVPSEYATIPHPVENAYSSVRCIKDDENTVKTKASEPVKAEAPAKAEKAAPAETEKAETVKPSNADYSSALKTNFPNGELGANKRPIQAFFQNVSKYGNSYSISGYTITKAAQDKFNGTLTISGTTKGGGSCSSNETELKGTYNLDEVKSKTSGRFTGQFTACESGGRLTKANFKGDWVKHSDNSKSPCNWSK